MALTKVRRGGTDTGITDASDATAVTIDSSENVMINGSVSNPAFSNTANQISLRGSVGTIEASRDGGGCLELNRKTSDGTIVNFRKDGTIIGSINCNGGSLDIGGGDVGIGFYQVADGIVPINNGTGALRDDAIDLGNPSGRFDDIHATNSSIQTSDQNEKQDIASITSKELNVAKKLSALFKTFRWKSKVAEKGDKARTHTGIIAQEIQSAFSAEGLDASKYGLFTSSTWWEKDERVYFTKEEAPKDATERTRLGVRYPELFSFIFSSIEARLTALESK
jgi:hypothetical protein